MKAYTTPVVLLLITLSVAACPLHWGTPSDVEQSGGEQTLSQYIRWELGRIPAERPASAVFADFRDSYQRNPEAWGQAAVESLLAFEPEDESQTQEFLGFVCYLAGEGDKYCEHHLNMVMVAIPNGGPYPLFAMASNQKYPIGEFFDHWKVSVVGTDYYERTLISLEKK